MRKSFKMKLFKGQEKEYEKRHNELWPEMKEMIHEYGGKNYSIFLDKETNILYGYIELESEEKVNIASLTKIMTTIVAIENIENLDRKVC